jgi:hypothetical protein
MRKVEYIGTTYKIEENIIVFKVGISEKEIQRAFDIANMVDTGALQAIGKTNGIKYEDMLDEDNKELSYIDSVLKFFEIKKKKEFLTLEKASA